MPQDRYNGRGSGRTGRPARGGSSRDARRSPQGGRTRRATSSRASERRGADAPSGRLSTELVSRHGLLAGGFLAASAIVLARLSEIQVFNTDWYREQANARRVSSQTLYAKRGAIYDRNGTVLVSSIECKNVYLNPSLIKKKQRRRAIDALVDVLGMDEDVVEDLVDREGTFVYVKRQVDEEDAELLAKKGIAGIEFEPAIKRVYPNGSLASQVLGVVNVDNEGITGLEKQYNEVLTGVNGSLMRERARDGSFIAGGAYEKVPAQDGMDIVLGIDANVQRVAEDAIAEAVERVGATYGSIIVTDPTTGEIIAACSYPTYDPTDLASASNASMNLRVVTDVYEPGSVFKTFVSAAAIEHKGLTPNTTFDVPAEVLVGSDIVRDVDKRGAAMTMSLREILRRSSNTGMVLVGEKLGADAFSEYVIDGFQFGKSTGIDFPGESLGIIKKRSEYDGASLGSMSFGQSLAVEPVQMVRAMSAIANKGVMTTPHFLKTRAGEEVDWTDGEHRVLSEETAASVADMMLTVVDEGTGMDAQMPGYEVSGKTGTAERAGKDGGYEEGNNMASFMGFVSTKDPRVLCYVTLDGTAAMSYAATPVFRKVMEEALPALGIKPTR